MTTFSWRPCRRARACQRRCTSVCRTLDSQSKSWVQRERNTFLWVVRDGVHFPSVVHRLHFHLIISSSIKYLNEPHKINHWQTYNRPYHCNVVLSHLFIYFIILSYCSFSIFIPVFYIFLRIPFTCLLLDFILYMHYYVMWFKYSVILCILQSAICLSIPWLHNQVIIIINSM